MINAVIEIVVPLDTPSAEDKQQAVADLIENILGELEFDGFGDAVGSGRWEDS